MKQYKSVCIIYEANMTEFHICSMETYENVNELFDNMKPENMYFYIGEKALAFLDSLLANK